MIHRIDYCATVPADLTWKNLARENFGSHDIQHRAEVSCSDTVIMSGVMYSQLHYFKRVQTVVCAVQTCSGLHILEEQSLIRLNVLIRRRLDWGMGQ